MNARLRTIGSDTFTTTGMQSHWHDRCSPVVGTGVDPVTSRFSVSPLVLTPRMGSAIPVDTRPLPEYVCGEESTGRGGRSCVVHWWFCCRQGS